MEFVVNFDQTGKTVAQLNRALLDKHIFGGYDLSRDLPQLGQSMLVCVTEKTELSDIDALCDAADCIRRMFAGNAVDSCSIVNARRGFAPKTANGVRRLRATIQAAMSTTI